MHCGVAITGKHILVRPDQCEAASTRAKVNSRSNLLETDWEKEVAQLKAIGSEI